MDLRTRHGRASRVRFCKPTAGARQHVLAVLPRQPSEPRGDLRPIVSLPVRDVPGKRIVVEGVAEDGTIEAIRIADAPGFALGVQWHAEYDPQKNPVNRKLFQAFGKALVEKRDS